MPSTEAGRRLAEITGFEKLVAEVEFEARQQGRDRDLREWARLKGLEDLARELVDRWHNGTITRPEAEIIEAMARALSEQGTR